MLPFLPLLVPGLVQAPVSDWDKAREVLVSTIDKKGGLGILLSLDHATEGHLTIRFLERQSSDSAYELVIQPLDPGPGAEQKPFAIQRAGDFTSFQTRAVPFDLRVANVTEQLHITLNSQEFAGKIWSLPLPKPGSPAKVIILYLPKR